MEMERLDLLRATVGQMAVEDDDEKRADLLMTSLRLINLLEPNDS